MRARALLVLLLCSLALPGSAWAHATLVRVTPENGTVLSTSPTAVRLVFDDGVRAGSGIKAVRNDGSASVLAGNARVVGGRTLVVPLRHRLADGDYTVLWRVVSDDGHTIAGVTVFGVGAGRPPPTAALTVRNGPTVKDVISRWLLFAGLLTAVGAAVFRLAVAGVSMRVFLGAFLLVFIGVSGLLHDVPVSSRFGGSMAAVAIVAGIGALFAAIAPVYPVLEPAVLAAALLLLPGPSIGGHALDRGRSPFEVVADIAHVAAASVWLGGLLALGLALRREGDRSALMRRFSTIAVVSVGVLALTGIVRALAELDTISQLWTTGYGRTLLVKTGLLLALVTIGWVNRYRLVPRLQVTALRRNVAAELVLFAGLVVAVALLTDLRPGRDRNAAAAITSGPPPLPATAMAVQARELGDYAVALAVRASREEVIVLGQDGQGVNGLAVNVDGVKTSSCGSGCYGASVPLRRTATVSVNGDKLQFTIAPHPTDATTLVTRATRAFRAQRSVDYVERLASSPRNKVVSDFTLERPNKLEYRILGGASGIIIGAHRWDRAGKGPWVESGQSPLPQPEPIWAGHFTNAFLLDTTPTAYVVSFMKPLGPTWFTLRLDRRTLLPRDLRMTTAAHFMTHRYTRFGAPPRITAPTRAR
ncbi:MAG: copper resistance CopC/CopD family protein [Gaiellaceae bacterium]